MKRHLSRVIVMFLIWTGVTTSSAQAGRSDDAIAFFAGWLIGLAEQREAEEQTNRQRELEAQNESLRRYIAERLIQERRIREAESKQIEAEIQRRKAVTLKPEISISTGSGFFLAMPGYLITNAHVLSGDYLYIRDRDGKLFSATLIAKDNIVDLALIKTKINRRGLSIGRFSSVTKGQKVYAIGYPVPGLQGSESKITDGIISSFSGLGNNDKRFQISTPIQPGNSGGPLINEKGEVVGVVVAKASDQRYIEVSGTIPQNVNYAVRTDAIENFLKLYNVDLSENKTLKNPLDHADANTVMVVSTGAPINLPFDTEITIKEAEAIAWKNAKSDGACSALDSYIATHKGSRNYQEALRIRSGAELAAWNVAKQSDTVAGYRVYEGICPGNTRKPEIEKSIATIEARETKIKADLEKLNVATKSNDCREIESYIRDNPDGHYFDIAKDWLRKLGESKYDYARRANNVTAWSNLIETCPNSRFAFEARNAMAGLVIAERELEAEKQQVATMRDMLRQKKFFELSEYAQTIIDGGSIKVAPYEFAGVANMRLGKLIDAEHLFAKALLHAPGNQYINFALGHVRLILGDLNGALGSLSVLDNPLLAPNIKQNIKQRVYEDLAIAHYRAKNDDASLGYLEKMSEMDQENAERLRKFLYRSGVVDFLVSLLGSGTKRVTEDQWWVIYVANPLLEGDWVQTANMSAIYTDKIPSTSYGWYAWGLSTYALGDKDGAERYFAEGYGRDPSTLRTIGKFFASAKATRLLDITHTLLMRIDPAAADQFKDKYLSATAPTSSAGIQSERASENQEHLAGRFVAGTFRLDCQLTCLISYRQNQEVLARLHSEQAWEALSNEVIRIGYKNNLAYYYLGRSAEGLGHNIAATTYYRLGKALRNKCTEDADSRCGGIVFPREFDTALKRVIQ